MGDRIDMAIGRRPVPPLNWWKRRSDIEESPIQRKAANRLIGRVDHTDELIDNRQLMTLIVQSADDHPRVGDSLIFQIERNESTTLAGRMRYTACLEDEYRVAMAMKPEEKAVCDQ